MAGDTALHVAAQYGHRYVVQVLVEVRIFSTTENPEDKFYKTQLKNKQSVY